ncbi:GyrI-like domain-containing protein [Sinomonas sp.]|jgi:hypothetical protein|uniref:GyrI-like domain-containing protein n=1 Tax=Sinomonas sp. TaxID=1914986 RepID=UPI002FDFA39E
MSVVPQNIDSLYKVRRGEIEFVDVPELSFVMVEGQGEPEGPAFTEAVQALFSVSYAAHFAVKKHSGEATKVMPLEALWWVDEPEQVDAVTNVALGEATMAETDRDKWRWQAMMMQPKPIDAAVVAEVIEESRGKQLPALDLVRFEAWEEGRCAQALHVGAYADEAPTIVRLHDAIAEAGLKPRGHHHEIYLGDPRRTAPENLRTLIRQPVGPPSA